MVCLLDGGLAPLGASVAEPDLDLVVAEAGRGGDLFATRRVRIVRLREHRLEHLDLARAEAGPQAPILRQRDHARQAAMVELVALLLLFVLVVALAVVLFVLILLPVAVRLLLVGCVLLAAAAVCRVLLLLAVLEVLGDGAHARHVARLAHVLVDQASPYLVAQHVGTLGSVLVDLGLDLGRGGARLAAADRARPDAARLGVALQDLAHAAVRDAQLTRDDARSRALRGHLDDAHADARGQRTTVDEHAAQLVDSSLT